MKERKKKLSLMSHLKEIGFINFVAKLFIFLIFFSSDVMEKIRKCFTSAPGWKEVGGKVL